MSPIATDTIGQQTMNGIQGKDNRRPVTIAVVGAGQRGQTYASYALTHPDQAKVVAVAEPRPVRRKVTAAAHAIPSDMQFSDWRDLLALGRIADTVFICVMDQMHAELVKEFSKQGYHIFCEKPMATTVPECVQMVKDVRQSDKVFGMGHVLRYSKYNQAIKDIIDSGAIGEIVNIQHIEPIGDHHFTHSYVRGNWHKESETSFSLMTKCCHDIDILSFYLSGKAPKRVSSFGSLFHFKPSQKPAKAGSATRCLDCAYEPECAWSAKKIYLDPFVTKQGNTHWAELATNAEVLDIESVSEMLKTTNYGKCVYEADNDVVDHQVVNIEYEGGTTASLTMSAFTESQCDRGTKIHGTKGEIIGDMHTFTVFDFLTRERTLHTPINEGGLHGGADVAFSRTFVKAVATGDQDVLGVTPEQVLDSHLLVFAAEKARLEGTVVDYQAFKQTAFA
ncbi:putative NAD-binding Rossmann fold oxidoreductase [Papiliotrema laurentii]|uniref:NAD-binding Rossmann fold oxidoreductase n=1 Tax=Papiliotrema laurentii TaxID=5418 RepID=A0AAD9FSL6_PAPLA|nr:putative NAD-binding Rossmann fold oxidoreductase [Papiliotrema laurentii]